MGCGVGCTGAMDPGILTERQKTPAMIMLVWSLLDEDTGTVCTTAM